MKVSFMILLLLMQQTGVYFYSTTGSATVTVNKTAHGLEVGDYFKFKSVTLPGGGETGLYYRRFYKQMYLKLLQPTAGYFYYYYAI
jgi:hypothetical protein